MTVIVLSRDPAIRGDHIAGAIAERFNLGIVLQQELIERVAEEISADQRSVRRIIDGNASLLECCKHSRRRLLRCLAREITAVAAGGNVLIEARGAAALLGPISHVVQLYIGSAQPHIPPASDRQAVRIYTNALLRIHIEHWILDPGRVPPERYLALDAGISAGECVEQVDRLLQHRRHRQTDGSRAALDEMRCLLAAELRGNVVLGSEQVPLAGGTSNEEAIAQVEAWLRRSEAAAQVKVRFLPPRAPDGIL